MNTVQQMVTRISADPDCVVKRAAVSELPVLTRGILPGDLIEWYGLVNSARLFPRRPHGFEIVAPAAVTSSNLEIIGRDVCGDISDWWVIIARQVGDRTQCISIDTHPERVGRVYDSFWDRHGVAGSCPIIARTFMEFVGSVYSARGEYLYWMAPGFVSLGDAYD